jgi:hypothetical protein
VNNLLAGAPRYGNSRFVPAVTGTPTERLLIEAAREWLLDCEFPDLSRTEIWDMDPTTVISAVNRHFGGGWAGFAADNENQVT